MLNFNRIVPIAALIAVSLLAGQPAFAQRWDRQLDRDGREYRQDRDARDYRQDRGGRDYRQDRGPVYGVALPNEGAGPGRDIFVGQHLPRRYGDSSPVVEDWASKQLHAPIPGFRWIQVGNDFVLVNTTSGMVGEVWVAR